MCAAAFVQNRKSYTGCTDAPNPCGESGRAWCYVEAQVALHFLCHGACLPSVFDELLDTNAAEAAWNYCAPVVDYDALRKEISSVFEDRAAKVQAFVARLQKTQRAAEQALDRSVSDACCQAHGCFCAALAGMRRCALPRAEAAEMSCGI